MKAVVTNSKYTMTPSLKDSADSSRELIQVHPRTFVPFYRASYASAVLAVIGCLSVCLSVTSRTCTKMAKPRIRLTTPYDSPETLVLRCQKSRRNSNDITPTGAPNGGGVGSNRAISTTEQLCRSDAVPPTHCIRPRWLTPTTRLRWRSDIGLLLSTTSAQSRLQVLFISTRGALTRFRLH